MTSISTAAPRPSGYAPSTFPQYVFVTLWPGTGDRRCHPAPLHHSDPNLRRPTPDEALKEREALQRYCHWHSQLAYCASALHARQRQRTKRFACRWIQPPAAIVEQGISATLAYLRRIWGSASTLALDLSLTGATYFPPEVFEKRFSRLTDINLAHCDLQELPLNLTMFTNLRSDPVFPPFYVSVLCPG